MGWVHLTFASLFFFVASTTAMAADQLLPEKVNVPLSKAFIPVGFDSNDRVQVTVEGTFPNTCYKVGPYSVQKDESAKAIRIQQTAYKYTGTCLMVQVPFVQTIEMGLLREGGWAIIDAGSEVNLGTLPVEVAKTESPDEFLYAPVGEANVFKDPTTNKTSLGLNGTFTDRCTTLKEVRVQYYPGVVVVLPIAEHNVAGRECGPQMTRFTHTLELKDGLEGVALLHVRSMNGQAINKVVEFP